MAFSAISGAPTQYAANHYLKFYESGTTVPYSVATDATGSVRLAKVRIGDAGYPLTNANDESTKFIPYVDQDYRIVLYATEADADANNTANAVFNIDGIAPNVAQLTTTENISTKGTNLQVQDDYDRSPLFVDGVDFTAGAGPHTITLPSGWQLTVNPRRYYKLAANGVVTPLTPTLLGINDFTIAETLLSDDVVFIGDDTFRNQFDGDPEDIRGRLDLFRKSNNLSDVLSTSDARTNLDVYSKSETDAIVTYSETTISLAGIGVFTSGTLKLAKINNIVVLSVVSSSVVQHSNVTTASAPTGTIPSDYRPINDVFSASDNISRNATLAVRSDGRFDVFYYDQGSVTSESNSRNFTISYVA